MKYLNLINIQISALEKEQLDNLAKLKALNERLDDMRNTEYEANLEKDRLEDEMELLQQERADLIDRMNDLTSKYEEYVNSMSMDREEIARANKRHMKLLTAKLLFNHLSHIIASKSKDGLSEIKLFNEIDYKSEKKVKAIMNVLIKHYENRQIHALRTWHKNSMSWMKERRKTEGLTESKSRFKSMTKFFHQWRAAYVQSVRNYDDKIEAIKLLKSLGDYKGNLSLRKTFNTWKTKSADMKFKELIAKKLILKAYLRELSGSFVHWLKFSKAEKEKEKLERFISEVGHYRYLQSLFDGMKEGCEKFRQERVLNKFKVLADWRRLHKEHAYFKTAEDLTEKIDNLNVEMLVKRVFDAIKRNVYYFLFSNV